MGRGSELWTPAYLYSSRCCPQMWPVFHPLPRRVGQGPGMLAHLVNTLSSAYASTSCPGQMAVGCILPTPQRVPRTLSLSCRCGCMFGSPRFV